jgi:hypothetical protein
MALPEVHPAARRHERHARLIEEGGKRRGDVDAGGLRDGGEEVGGGAGAMTVPVR